jgi:hypothetical protein
MRTVPWSALLLGVAALGLRAPHEAVSVLGLDQAAEGRSGKARVVEAGREVRVARRAGLLPGCTDCGAMARGSVVASRWPCRPSRRAAAISASTSHGGRYSRLRRVAFGAFRGGTA